jgi:hypothetical protein
MAGTAGGTTAERRIVTTRNSSSERESPICVSNRVGRWLTRMYLNEVYGAP